MEEERRIFQVGSFFFELTKGIIIFIIVITLVHFFIATIFKVEGASMEPNFYPDQYILVNRISYLVSQPQRGDVVILKFPGDPEHSKYVKRIIGLPGEKITLKDGLVYINDQKMREVYLPSTTLTEPDMTQVLGEKEYFIMGDNRGNSNDSRAWGVAPRKFLIGKAVFFLFPFEYWGLIPKLYY